MARLQIARFGAWAACWRELRCWAGVRRFRVVGSIHYLSTNNMPAARAQGVGSVDRVAKIYASESQ